MSERLVLATDVGHTVAALRSLASRRGVACRNLGPGLLELEGHDLATFVAEAGRMLSVVEADEVRCLSTPADVSDRDLLVHAMRAPSLAAAAARVAHADLLPLFDKEHEAFYSVYQPIVDLADGGVIGHEALLRATDAAGSVVMPLALFEAGDAAGWTGLLDRIGRTTALRQAGPWLGDDLLFINFVASSIYRPEICLRTTVAAAAQAGLRMDQLVFEVSESHLVRDVRHLDDVFAYYRARGCQVALDDLGAGYSSLNLLVRLKPDVVKLDKAIVQALPDAVGVAVVAAVVSIVGSYGGKVLAEGIETVEQAHAARELGVDHGQGWYFGRPVRPALVTSEPDPRAESTGGRGHVDPSRPDAAIAWARAGELPDPSRSAP